MISAAHNFSKYYLLMALARKLYHANPVNVITKSMDISNTDVLDLLKALNKHKVKYMLVGGMAVVFHGYIRTTQDMDIWIKKDLDNQQNLSKALLEVAVAGAEYLHDTQLVMGYTSVPFGRHGFTLDMGHELKLFKAQDFDQCYQRAIQAEIEGVPFCVIHINDLIAEKKQTDRTKDRLDIEELEKLPHSRKPPK